MPDGEPRLRGIPQRRRAPSAAGSHIDTIAEREKLTATEGDIDDRVAEVASKRNADPAQVYASLQKAGRLREIEHSITEEKVFAWLLERNTVE